MNYSRRMIGLLRVNRIFIGHFWHWARPNPTQPRRRILWHNPTRPDPTLPDPWMDQTHIEFCHSWSPCLVCMRWIVAAPLVDDRNELPKPINRWSNHRRNDLPVKSAGIGSASGRSDSAVANDSIWSNAATMTSYTDFRRHFRPRDDVIATADRKERGRACAVCGPVVTDELE